MSLVRNGVGKSRDFRGKCGGFLCVLVSTSAEKLQFSGGGGGVGSLKNLANQELRLSRFLWRKNEFGGGETADSG
jgi:hypothetical protein